jgi:hypothetical protein
MRGNVLISETDAFKTAVMSINQHLAMFASYGLTYVDQSFDTSKPERVRLTFKFENTSTKLGLWLTFSPAKDGLNGGFVVLLLRVDGERLNLKDYLRLHGNTPDASFLLYTEATPDLAGYIEGFLSTLDQVFQHLLKPILAGERWESTPIDWQGYK